MRARLLGSAALLAAAVGCQPELPFRCKSDGQCREGKCVNGYCVVDKPSIESFVATASPIMKGQSTTLVAVFKNGKGSIEGIGDVESEEPVTVSPTKTTTYVLTVKNTAWPAETASATVEVSARSVPAFGISTGAAVGGGRLESSSYRMEMVLGEPLRAQKLEGNTVRNDLGFQIRPRAGGAH